MSIPQNTATIVQHFPRTDGSCTTSPSTRTDAHQQKEHPARTHLKSRLTGKKKKETPRTLCEQVALRASCPNSQRVDISDFVAFAFALFYFVAPFPRQVKRCLPFCSNICLQMLASAPDALSARISWSCSRNRWYLQKVALPWILDEVN
ncbi:hypothetical protein CDAR_313061 [Caerostris darwini]|uniref:Uncharacterized protein n=1 Tax=Caerostris darwini TaxID=1538125 RepID=A0AAV4RYX7_9ARAC|nr:hypothetical protein CDAR_313061 [Caerostris darwini]